MKKIAVISMMLLVAASAFAKKDWKGKVVDEKGEPVAYATVAVLSQVDSTVLCGVTTGEDGLFNIVTKDTGGIMMVSLLGYQTVCLSPVDGAVITLKEDATMLEGAAVSAVMPKTTLTGEGLQTNVRGSVLENAGNANDVLAKTPGMVKGRNGLEVIGKGAPLIYINGHKVSDAGELDRLQSNEIQSVEVITNPGAQYDASVRSVVRIKTIRRKGDGFGFGINASDAQSLRWARGNDAVADLKLNYRSGGLDFFGGVNYRQDTGRQESDLVKTTMGKDYLMEEKGDLISEGRDNRLSGNAGMNWQIADNHFLGGKVEWTKSLRENGYSLVNDAVYRNGTLDENITTVTDDALGEKGGSKLGANLYYNGKIAGKLGVDVNLDYYGTGSSTISSSAETCSTSDDRAIQSMNSADGRLYAAKAVFSYPIWTGQLEAGTEETFSRRYENYSISGIDIPASEARVKEDNYAGFVNYGFMLPFGQFGAGLRYEYVHYEYIDELKPENNIPRSYSNLFPTFSYAGAAGPVQLMFNYSRKTKRPNYAYLSNAIRYNSRYVWQSGDARLQPKTSHNLSAMAAWKFITVGVDYARTDNAILTWSAPYNEEGVVLVRPRNIDSPYRTLGIFVSLTPTIGPWNLNYSFAVQPQWLTLDLQDPREDSGIRVARFSGKPICMAQMFNTFTLNGGWQLEVGGTLITPGYTENIYLKNWYCDVSAAVQKTLLKDGSLVLRLEGSDLIGAAHNDVDTDFGSHTIMQTNRMDTQKVKLSVRYNFNAAKSKYLGTGAGTDSRRRM